MLVVTVVMSFARSYESSHDATDAETSPLLADNSGSLGRDAGKTPRARAVAVSPSWVDSPDLSVSGPFLSTSTENSGRRVTARPRLILPFLAT